MLQNLVVKETMSANCINYENEGVVTNCAVPLLVVKGSNSFTNRRKINQLNFFQELGNTKTLKTGKVHKIWTEYQVWSWL